MIAASGFIDMDRESTVVTLHLHHHDADQVQVLGVLTKMLEAIPGSTNVLMDNAGIGAALASGLERMTHPRVRVRRA